MSRIEVNLEDEGSRRLWKAVGDLADGLPGEWVLIGGLMVQLHALERGITDVRPTRESTFWRRRDQQAPSQLSMTPSGGWGSNRPAPI